MASPEQIASQLQLDQLFPTALATEGRVVTMLPAHILSNLGMRTHPHVCTHSHKTATAYPEILQLLFLEGIHGLCQVVGGTVGVHRGPLCTGLRLASGSQEVQSVTGWPLDP